MMINNEIIRIALLLLFLAVLFVAVIVMQGLVDEPLAFCEEEGDCMGTKHHNCTLGGHWECISGYCNWKCVGDKEYGVDCFNPNDCEGRPHIECMGGWKCRNRSCEWECVNNKDYVEPAEQDGGVLVLEAIIMREGQLIGGTYPQTFLRDIEYDIDNGVLSYGGGKYEYINDSFLVFALTNRIGGGLGTGKSSNAYGVYDVPWDLGEFRLNRVWNSGEVAIEYGDELFELGPGELWEHKTVLDETGPHNTGLIRITTEIKLINHGKLEVRNIENDD